MNDKDIIWNLAPHDISIVNYLLDEIPQVASAHGFSLNRKDYWCTADIILRYPRDFYANIHLSWKEPRKIRRMVIMGTKKIIIFDEMEVEKIKIFDTKDLRKYTIADVDPITPLEKQCLHFAECIKKRIIPKTGGESGLAVTKIIENIENCMNHR